MICIDNKDLERELTVGKEYELLDVYEVPYGLVTMKVFLVEVNTGKAFIIDKSRFKEYADLV